MSDDDNGSIASSRTGNLPIRATSEEQSVEPEQTPSTKHSVYYFDPVVFRVQGILFKVPKHGFMVPGSMFYDMFSLPIAEGQEAEGSDSNPINPPSITHREFFGFLFVMYPLLGFAAHQEINYEELVGALRLATMWQFPKIRSSAMSLLSPFLTSKHPVENILLARQYGWRSLLRQGYITLISKHITVEDLRHPHELDWEAISKIFAAKTQLMEGVNSIRCSKCKVQLTLAYSRESNEFHTTRGRSETGGPTKSPVGDCVDSMFRDEIEKMENDSASEVDGNYIQNNFGFYLSRPTFTTRSETSLDDIVVQT